MANERQRRLMQDALDDALPQEARQELFHKLDEMPEEAEVFGRLKQVDRLLRSAPMERAPERLALKIMARLAEGLQLQSFSETASMALGLALALVTLLMLPLLAAIGWLLLTTLSDAAALSELLKNLSNILISLMNGLEGLMTSAQQAVEQYPQTSAAMLALIPLAVIWLARYAGQRSSGTSGE